MTIAVVGLGLIGGSFCMHIKKRTNDTVLGLDNNPDVLQEALRTRAIDRAVVAGELGEADWIIICLYPQQTLQFIEENVCYFSKQALIIDACGVKGFLCRKTERILLEKSLHYLSIHPMAGKERSGFFHASDALFIGADLILIRSQTTNVMVLEMVQKYCKTLGFGKQTVTDADTHDKIIAYTSQLAHIVSNAYVKSNTAELSLGYTGGSYQDLTRVALLNAPMWSELFMCNQEYLLNELRILCKNLSQYCEALENKDKEYLEKLLQEGSDQKANLL